MADEIGTLVASGTKIATCSALWEWEAEDEHLPEPGAKCIVLDGRGEPPCIIETTDVEVRSYNEVEARFAYDEGEEDRSLQHWRDTHWRFFTRSLAEIGKEANAGDAAGLRAVLGGVLSNVHESHGKRVVGNQT